MAGSPLTTQAIEDQIPDHGTYDVAAMTGTYYRTNKLLISIGKGP